VLASFRERLRESLDAFRSVVTNPALRRVELSWAAAITSYWAFIVALAVYAYNEGGATAVGLVGLIRILPAFVSAPFAGLLGDRYPRERLMLIVSLARAALMAATAAVLFAGFPAWTVYALSGAVALTASMLRPIQSALLPQLARTPEELTAANLVLTTVESSGIFLGPAAGGLLLAATNSQTVFAAAAGAFLVGALLLAGIRAEAPPERKAEVGFAREFFAGFGAIGKDRNLRLIIGLYGAQTFVSGALTVLIVVMALQLLHMGQSGVGTLNAAVGVGGLLGSLVAAALVGRGRLAVNLAAGLIAWGVPIALIAPFTHSWFAFAMLLIVGIGNVLVDVAALTMLQRVAADEVLGRVFGVMEAVLSITVGVGAAVTPFVIDAVGVRGALLATGAVLPILVLVTWPLLSRADPGALQPERVALMRNVPFLAPLPEATLERIGSLLEPVAANAASPVFEQGDAGDRFYLIERGEVTVERDGAELARLGPGDYFGEIALVQDVPRTATVRPLTDTALLALDRDEFIAAVTGHAPSQEAADAVIMARLGGLRAGAASL
jgi:MFS family permease